MRRICFLLALLLCVTSFCSCGRTRAYSSAFYLMNTPISVTLYANSQAQADEIFLECERLLFELEQLWARQQPTSEVSRMNISVNGVSELDARTVSLLKTALAVSAATDGAFDITVTPLVELWARCEEEGRLPTSSELDAALLLVNSAALSISDETLTKPRPEIAIDLGGIGKGAAISLLIEYLESTEVGGGLVSFGSNVAVFGEKPDQAPFRVAIKHPRLEGASIGTLTMPVGGVLSVSGDYERYVTIDGVQYHHILDPTTGYPAASGLASVAVLTTDGALADALSTALFVMGESRARELYASGIYDFEAIFVDTDGNVRYTDGMKDIFVLEEA